MSVLLAVVGLPVVLVLPGLVTLVAWAPLRRLDWMERLYLTLAISLLLSGWAGVLLAQLGCFSAGLLVAILAAYTVVVGLASRRPGRWAALIGGRPFGDGAAAGQPKRPRPGSLWLWVRQNASPLLFAAISAIFVGLAFRPFELILGPRDAAVYPAMAAQIARHGGIRISDPFVSTLSGSTPAETHLLFTQFFGVQHPGRFYYHYLRMPGFFIANTDEGVYIPQFLPANDGSVVVPQFYPLYPTWLAIAFSLLGLQAGLLMTPYLSFLGGIGVFLLVRRLWGERVALLAYLFLALQTLQVWFARYSTAEGATQFLFFLGLLAMACLEEDDDARRRPFWGLLAGAAIGMIGLVRVEFFFPWLLLLPYFLYLYVARRMERAHRAMLLTAALSVLHTALLFVTHTRGYTLGIYYHRIQDWATLSWLVVPFLTPTLREYWFASDTPRTQVLHQPWRPAVEIGVVLLVAAGLVLLRRQPRLTARIGAWVRRRRSALLTASAGLFLLAFAYAYLLRPGILTPDVLLHPAEHWLRLQGYVGAPVAEGAAANLVRLGWYFSPLGMLLAAAGIALLLVKGASRRSWFLLVLGLFYLALFSYETFADAHHIYVMRRYVAMVVPFFSIAMAYALVRLGGDPLDNAASAPGRRRSTRRSAAGALALLLCVYLVYSGLPFYQHREYAGALRQVAALADKFGPQDIILLIDDARDAPYTIATPLRFLFDRNAVVIVPAEPNGALIEEQIERWQAAGRQVYLLVGNDGGRLMLPHTRLRWLERFELAVSEFEALRTQKPHNAHALRQAFGLYVPEAWDGAGSVLGDLPLTVDLGHNGYIYQAGGFYADETDPDGTTYCWTKGRGALRLPWPEDSAPTVTLRLAGGKRPAELGPAEVQLSLGGWSVGPYNGEWTVGIPWTLTTDFAPYTVSMELCPAQAGVLPLTIVSSTWRQVDYGLGNDARPLGVEVDWVQVERAEGSIGR